MNRRKRIQMFSTRLVGPKWAHAVVADFVAVAEKFRQMIVIGVGIGADQTGGPDMVKDEAAGIALFTAQNGSDRDLSAISCNRSQHDRLVVVLLLADEGFVHLHGTAQDRAEVRQELGKPHKPAMNRRVGESGYPARILRRELGKPSGKQEPQLLF